MKIKKRFLIKLGIAGCLYIIAVLLCNLTSHYIRVTFQNPPVAPDLLWMHLPYLPITWLSEIFLGISVLYILNWALKKDKDFIPYAISVYSIFQIIRAFLIILTPLGIPSSYSGLAPIGGTSVFAYGAFPSGHLAYPVLTYLITRKKIVLFFSLIVALALLIARGHYTIDLIGTIMLAYCLYKLSERYIKEYFIENKP